MHFQKYSAKSLPEHIKQQIFSSIQNEWPDALAVARQYFADPMYKTLHFVITDDDQLVCHAALITFTLHHASNTYILLGLVAVMTLPKYRKQRFGLQILQEVKKYTEQSGADLMLFFTQHVGFYEKAGFEYMGKMKVIKGDPRAPIEEKDRAYMLFLSQAAKEHRHEFETKPVYIGEKAW